MDVNALAERLRSIANGSKQLRADILNLADELDQDTSDQDRWDEAIKNARFMLEEYKKIPSGVFGATAIASIIVRYENGERTKELLEELEDIQ